MRGATGKVNRSFDSDQDPELQRLVLIDSMAREYGLLPSEIMSRADSLDMWIFTQASSWRHRAEEAARTGKKMPTRHYDQAELMAMIERVRNPNKNSGK